MLKLVIAFYWDFLFSAISGHSHYKTFLTVVPKKINKTKINFYINYIYNVFFNNLIVQD